MNKTCFICTQWQWIYAYLRCRLEFRKLHSIHSKLFQATCSVVHTGWWDGWI